MNLSEYPILRSSVYVTPLCICFLIFQDRSASHGQYLIIVSFMRSYLRVNCFTPSSSRSHLRATRSWAYSSFMCSIAFSLFILIFYENKIPCSSILWRVCSTEDAKNATDHFDRFSCKNWICSRACIYRFLLCALLSCILLVISSSEESKKFISLGFLTSIYSARPHGSTHTMSDIPRLAYCDFCLRYIPLLVSYHHHDTILSALAHCDMSHVSISASMYSSFSIL